MTSRDTQEILANFIAVTQCSSEEATRYLEAAEWNSETAMEIFYDDGSAHIGAPISSTNTQSTRVNVNQASGETGDYESDDESPMQTAIDESLRISGAATKSTAAGSKVDKNPSASSKFGTIGGLQKEENSSDEEGQAFYAGGSERSGQQIIGPPKAKDVDKEVAKLFVAARKQGAVEADDDGDDDNGSSSQMKKKPFAGVGYTLGDDKTPSRPLGHELPEADVAPTSRAEQVPLRFFSNGFTVG
ncbi:unnamed protein product, partial [Rotaria socialis]